MAPYASKAQQRYFHYLESKGKMPKKVVKEYDDATDFEDLPEHVENYSHGGMVNYDEEMGHASEFVSSGEPGTEDHLEDEEPQYMSHGGRVKRMSHGGRVPDPSFVRALRKAR